VSRLRLPWFICKSGQRTVPTRRPTRRYSFLSLVSEARRNHTGWEEAWPKAEPKSSYDLVIIGGGGHGLATAYYLAKLHGMKNIAVLEKGWLGGGNTARNTAIIRSNYLRPQSMALYGLSHSLFEQFVGGTRVQRSLFATRAGRTGV